jgi:hypothetical protein
MPVNSFKLLNNIIFIGGARLATANSELWPPAQDRHQQLTATLTDFLQSIENVSPEQVGTQSPLSQTYVSI